MILVPKKGVGVDLDFVVAVARKVELSRCKSQVGVGQAATGETAVHIYITLSQQGSVAVSCKQGVETYPCFFHTGFQAQSGIVDAPTRQGQGTFTKIDVAFDLRILGLSHDLKVHTH